MHFARLFAVVVTAVLIRAGASPAFAQEKKFGVVLAYPTAVGVQWALNDRIALRERFSVFAEAGVGYSWGSLSQASIGSVTANAPATTKALAMRSGIGAIVYF
jgi:hypothetical protein